ncbi:hypothetical protein [Cesiribacter andamanensis]|uniref:Uncharacterized protein n=1 Tax=Cesiribacter andamanensis AMV16 TaxID=1279009 RepID=M7NHM0_9BACT|nr:hypothetical protein [Cesiribacter andamanensis]EMR01275.1 hypothetical protein ADICEAN_03600 [Cesiribacter andamanensis AMV16]
MKIPSLVRLPKYNKFTYEPRYYDPVKEEVTERAERIRREVEAQPSEELRGRLQAEWKQAQSRQETQAKQSSVSQLIFVVLFFFTFVGFIFYGNNALYLGLILIPVYIFLRVRQMRQNS